MGIGVVADFVSSGGYFAGHAGKPADMGAALKEGGIGVVAGKDFEQRCGGFTGSVIEGERNGRQSVRAAADRRAEPGATRSANSVGQSAGGRDGRSNGGGNRGG